MKRTCCCCFYNSVRSLILILSFSCIVSLFANVLLLNFAVIYNDDLLPGHFLAFSSKGGATVAPTESPVNRSRRALNNETDFDEGVPIADGDSNLTSELISEIQTKEDISNKNSSEKDKEGHPVADDSFEQIVAEATYPPTVPNTRRIILTRATPIPEKEVENASVSPESPTPIPETELDDSLGSPDSETTDIPSPATKRHAKDPSSVVFGRFYSQFIIGHLQLAFSLAFIFVPATVIFWTPLNMLRYWRLVFLVTTGILIFSTVVFCVFGRGQPAHWAENSWDPTSTHRMLQPVRVSRTAECGIMEMRTVTDYLKSIED
ncbi:hypothetical protein FO519_003208 [Halicephalobus sp. NKZ332]|nr:hypothetical protein FO519_003208 [Halicephalobus sp. NKZ332]